MIKIGEGTIQGLNRRLVDLKPKPPQLAGVDDAIQEGVKEQLIISQKFEMMAAKSTEPLIYLRATFPFDFFPNEIVVDVNKVDIITHKLFYKNIHSVFVKDISDVIVQISCSLQRGYEEVTLSICSQ